MIGLLKGEVLGIYEEQILLLVNGIGFNVKMPLSGLKCLNGIGEEIQVYTYLSVREDAMQLYGFLTRDDLELFKLIIQVNGIGPKGALAILSTMTTSDLRFAIVSEDVKAISKAPGIGSKSAQRLIIDLKDKISLKSAFDDRINNTNSEDSPMLSDAKSEAVEALTALGYSQSDAFKAVGSVEGITTVEEILKFALKNMR